MSTNHQEQRQHERLCAYVLGETQGAERERFEAELHASPELQAERERLEATIALIREAVPAEEALSSAARARLAEAAEGAVVTAVAKIHSWPVRVARHPLVAAAAVLALLAGVATLAYRSAGGVAPTREAELAKADLDARPAAPAAARQALTRERAAGDKESPQDPAVALRDAGEKAEAPLAEIVRPESAAERSSRDEAQAKLGELSDALAGGTQLGVDTPTSELRTYEEETALRALAPQGDHTVVAGVEGRQADADDWFFGKGEAGQAAAARPAADTDAVVAGGTAPQVGAVGHHETGTPSAFVSRAPRGGLGQGGGGSNTPQAAPSSPDLYADGGESDWFFGAGEKRHDGGSHKGPGDTVPPGVSERALAELSKLGYAGTPAPAEVERGKTLAGMGYFSDDDDKTSPYRFRAGIDHNAYCDEIIRFCRIRPNETPSMMFFRCWGDNPFELAQLDPVSTFAADVDTASYALARSYLDRGYMPTKAQIRTEEFVNYFSSGVPAPAAAAAPEGSPAAPLALHMDLAPSLFGAHGEWMLRVVLRGMEVETLERPKLALTFVVDTSGSMQQEDRLELVKHALRLLVGELRAEDSIAIVAFSNEARLVLPMTSAAQASLIETALYGLHADGSTNADAGLRLGYELAGAALAAGATNRVILLSDGVANVGKTDEGSMLAAVAQQRSKGIYLNTIGVGMGNHNDALLEQLADKGDGVCNYIDTPAEAYKVLVEDLTGAMIPIARDVKIQVEFDPTQVVSYRLLGYENRAVADADFRNDAVDAGEIGAGHEVTALYEIVRAVPATGDGPLATARVRYKPPFVVGQTSPEGAVAPEPAPKSADEARELTRTLDADDIASTFEAMPAGYQRAVIAAQFAEVLRRSFHARGDSYDLLMTQATRLDREARDAEFSDLCRLIVQHRGLILSNLPPYDAVAKAIEELSRHNYLNGQLDALRKGAGALSADELQKLQRENDELEARIRELLKQQLQSSGR